MSVILKKDLCNENQLFLKILYNINQLSKKKPKNASVIVKSSMKCPSLIFLCDEMFSLWASAYVWL